MEHKTIEWLNTKIWFRALKVVFIAIFAVTFLVINAIPFFSFGDYKSLDLGKTTVVCDNGTKFSLKDTGWTFKESEFDNITNDNFAYTSSFVDKCNGKITLFDYLENNSPSYAIGMTETEKNAIQQAETLSSSDGQFNVQDFTTQAQARNISSKDIFRYLSQKGYVKDGKITDTYNAPQPLTTVQMETIRQQMKNTPPVETPKPNFKLNVGYSYSGFLTLCLELFILANGLTIVAMFLLRGIFYYVILGKFRPQK